MQMNNLKQGYPYAWLDEVIEVTLNPAKTNVIDLQYQQLEIIETKFGLELKVVLNDLKASTFYLLSSKKIRAMVSQYYESLILLEKQAMMNLAAYPDDHPLAATGENIILYIQNMGEAFKKRYGKYITDSTNKDAVETKNTSTLNKLLCRLSVDQIGLILKAADDTKLIVASSISIIFRSIVPFLSTEKIKNISWNSMRKSTYHIEQIDKDVAIETLENLILKIKEY